MDAFVFETDSSKGVTVLLLALWKPYKGFYATEMEVAF